MFDTVYRHRVTQGDLYYSTTVLGAFGTDLDDAWDIAERSPMPLHMADIHLHRARLFLRHTPYPWQSRRHDLAEARFLIEKRGYGRRKPELEDAEAVVSLNRGR